MPESGETILNKVDLSQSTGFTSSNIAWSYYDKETEAYKPTENATFDLIPDKDYTFGDGFTDDELAALFSHTGASSITATAKLDGSVEIKLVFPTVVSSGGSGGSSNSNNSDKEYEPSGSTTTSSSTTKSDTIHCFMTIL